MSGWILRTVTSLFENIGTVQNGIDTISQSYTVTDRPGAAELEVTAGEVRCEDIGCHYGQEGGSLDHLSLTLHPGEKVAPGRRSGAGTRTAATLPLPFPDLEIERIFHDGQTILHVIHRHLRAQHPHA